MFPGTSSADSLPIQDSDSAKVETRSFVECNLNRSGTMGAGGRWRCVSTGRSSC